MRVQNIPKFLASRTINFSRFKQGVAAVREISQSALFPANCRLVSPMEALVMGLGEGKNTALILGFESHDHPVVATNKMNRWPALLRSAALLVPALVVALGASRFGALETVLFGPTDGLPPAGEVIPVVFLAAVVVHVLILLPQTLAFQAGFAQLRRARISGARANGHRPEAAANARSAT